jgi:excisionase family DNA binding protein
MPNKKMPNKLTEDNISLHRKPRKPVDQERLVGPEEFAEKLGISVSTLDDWIAKGKIEKAKDGRRGRERKWTNSYVTQVVREDGANAAGEHSGTAPSLPKETLADQTKEAAGIHGQNPNSEDTAPDLNALASKEHGEKSRENAPKKQEDEVLAATLAWLHLKLSYLLSASRTPVQWVTLPFKLAYMAVKQAFMLPFKLVGAYWPDLGPELAKVGTDVTRSLRRHDHARIFLAFVMFFGLCVPIVT